MTIEPLDGGREARITLDWHEPFRISEDNPLVSSRVDIGVFADNGAHDSAPAILSVFFPPHEARRYEPGPDGVPRIAAIDHAARPEVYADPLLLPRADWRDDFHYAADGALTGWTRSRAGGARASVEIHRRRRPGARARRRRPAAQRRAGRLPARPRPAGGAAGPGAFHRRAHRLSALSPRPERTVGRGSRATHVRPVRPA